MALYYELPIYRACYSLLLELFRLTRGFNREYKYTLQYAAIWEQMDGIGKQLTGWQKASRK
jgi:hypothetical protein